MLLTSGGVFLRTPSLSPACSGREPRTLAPALEQPGGTSGRAGLRAPNWLGLSARARPSARSPHAGPSSPVRRPPVRWRARAAEQSNAQPPPRCNACSASESNERAPSSLSPGQRTSCVRWRCCACPAPSSAVRSVRLLARLLACSLARSAGQPESTRMRTRSAGLARAGTARRHLGRALASRSVELACSLYI